MKAHLESAPEEHIEAHLLGHGWHRGDPSGYSRALGLDTVELLTFLGASQLPHRLDRGESAQLVILWDITDCSRLIRGQRPQIELTSILGTNTHEQLPDWVGPEFALNTQTENGACPAP
ncbi:MAG: hypothetical protein ACYDDU_00605 [Dermatophilaceae bacterium]